jgi:hypothetical protein
MAHGARVALQIVSSTDPGKQLVHHTEGRIASRDVAANVCHDRNQAHLLQVRALPAPEKTKRFMTGSSTRSVHTRIVLPQEENTEARVFDHHDGKVVRTMEACSDFPEILIAKRIQCGWSGLNPLSVGPRLLLCRFCLCKVYTIFLGTLQV